jgi:hypothetical protein
VSWEVIRIGEGVAEVKRVKVEVNAHPDSDKFDIDIDGESLRDVSKRNE